MAAMRSNSFGVISGEFCARKFDHHWNSSSLMHNGSLYGNNAFNLSLRWSHPQSSPAINLTALSIPVAFVIFSMVSPNPFDLFRVDFRLYVFVIF